MDNDPVMVKPKWGVHWFLAFLTGVLVSGFLSLLLSLFIWKVPDGNKEILVYMAGQLSGFTGAVIALWTGTTYNSSRKTELIAQAGPVDTNK